MGVGEEGHEAFGFITEAVEPNEGAFWVFDLEGDGLVGGMDQNVG